MGLLRIRIAHGTFFSSCHATSVDVHLVRTERRFFTAVPVLQTLRYRIPTLRRASLVTSAPNAPHVGHQNAKPEPPGPPPHYHYY